MIGLLVTLILFPLAGWSLGRRSIGEAFLFGAGLTGSILFLAGVIHAPLVVVLALIVVWGTGTAVWVLRHSPRPPSMHHPRLPTILMSLPFVALIFVAACTPLDDFDGRAFWVLKAKEIAREGAIDGPSFQAVTLDPRKNHYPILIPLDGAVILGIAHDFDDRQLRWFYLALLAALVLLVRERMGRLVSPSAGAWCAALLSWIPQFSVESEGGALSAYNDLAIAAFAAGAFFELMEEASRSGGLAVSASATPKWRDFGAIRFGLWLAFLVLTKNEGLPFAMILLAAGAFVFRKRITSSAIVAGTAAVALFVWRARIPPGGEEDIIGLLPTIPQKLHNLRAALAAFPRHMIAFSSWGAFWVAVIIAAAFAIRVDRRAATIAIAVIASMLAVYCGVYVATEWVVTDLIAVTANRLLMHLAAPALFLLALGAQWWTGTKSM
jgi:hypothetical protein